MLSHPTILVATDFSEASNLALASAEVLRKKTQGHIHVIHVTQYPEQWDWLTNDVVVSYYPPNFKQDLMNSLQERIHQQITRLGVEGSGEVLIGPPAKVILEYASTSESDLIILGHRGKGNFFHLGDVAAKVVAGADRPVLVINRDFEIERVAGLVDPMSPGNEIFNMTEELGYLSAGDVEFISLWPDQSVYVEESFPEAGFSVVKLTEEKKKEIEERMERHLRNHIDPHSGARVRAEVSPERKIRDGLVRVLEEEAIDLAVMSKHHKGKLEKILLGSVTRGILDHWHGNLMILPS